MESELAEPLELTNLKKKALETTSKEERLELVPFFYLIELGT